MKSVDCPVPGCTEIDHIAGRMREHFLYRKFLLKLRGATGGEAAAALLRHVHNAHSSGSAAQVSEDSALFQEY